MSCDNLILLSNIIIILKYKPLDFSGVLSSSIQFPREIINILLTSFSRSVLQVTAH